MRIAGSASCATIASASIGGRKPVITPVTRAEEAEAPPRFGRILYIKPSFFGDLPVDVVSYAAGSETFPHESTADQFFSESQFESYRRLCYFFTSPLGGDFDARDFPESPAARFFEAIDAQLSAAKQAEGGRIAKAVRAMKRRVGVKKED